MAVQGLAARLRHRARNRQRNPEQRVGAEPALVAGAIEYAERTVDRNLILGALVPKRLCDLLPDVLNRPEYALAAEAARVRAA